MRTILSRAEPPAITTIDCRYAKREKYAAAYMLDHDKEVAFVDNNTNEYELVFLNSIYKFNSSLGVSPQTEESVSCSSKIHNSYAHPPGSFWWYVQLGQALSQRQSACTPSRCASLGRSFKYPLELNLFTTIGIITGARAVYGETKFQELYGDIEPITSEKVVEIADGTTLTLGSSELEFIHTRGHARHHMVIYDKATKSVFTGLEYNCEFFAHSNQGTLLV